MGCGRVGSTLAHILEDRDNTVSVIDRDPEAFRRLRSSFKGDRVTGVGFDRAVLTQAGIERADAFVAVSSGDNSNIISARVARLGQAFVPEPGTVLQEGDVLHVVARESDLDRIAAAFATRGGEH